MALIQTVVHDEPDERERQLGRLGLSTRLIVGVVEHAVADAASCTSLDPPLLTGVMRWARTVRYLREGLVPMGWTPDDADNFATCTSPDCNVIVGVATGGGGAGSASREDPRTRYPKGPITQAYISRNEIQLSLFDAEPSWQPSMRVQFWMLLLNQVPAHMHVRADHLGDLGRGPPRRETLRWRARGHQVLHVGIPTPLPTGCRHGRSPCAR